MTAAPTEREATRAPGTASAASDAAPGLPPQSVSPVAWIWRVLGSMKLAVWLLLILGLLTWLGTLAQTERSTYDVQREYFESWFVNAKLPLSLWSEPLFPNKDGEGWALRIPLPGAYPVLLLLLINLVVGGLLRMKWDVRRSGILIVHIGIALLIVAGGVKLHMSHAGSLALYETPEQGGNSQRVYRSAQFSSFHDYELVLWRDDGATVQERVVPERELWAARDGGSVTLQADDLPFTVRVTHWLDFCSAKPKGPMFDTLMPVIDGAFLAEDKWRDGEERKSEHEIAGCYVNVFAEGGKQVEGILWGLPRLPHDRFRYPLTFELAGKRWGLDLRHVVYDLPFAVSLDRFQKLDHPGTMSPKDFRSFVRVHEDGAEREQQVFMNNPLRKDGFVVYQTNWGPQPMGGPPWYSVFEVSYNPSDVWPTIGCGVIALGLLIHFSMKLGRFLNSSTRKSLSA